MYKKNPAAHATGFSKRLDQLKINNFSPAERIFSFTELDSRVLREEFRANRARILAVTVGEFLAGNRIHNLLDRGNHGGGTAFGSFFELGEFFERNLAAFHGVAEVFGKLLQALALLF